MTIVAAERRPTSRPTESGRRIPVIVVVAFAVAALLIAWAIVVPLVAATDAIEVDPGKRFAPPGTGALLGRDHLGRDLAVMVALGLRTSLLLSVVVVAVSGTVGWLAGAVGAYTGGVVDTFLGRVMDVFNAFPGIILAIALVTVLGPSYTSLV